ncbi:MotA/TolQ/ExbB proton channel family protein [Phycisphaera mikurensis]|uniref:MotA/TolQ/ExbB family protein n=1 Tax=Phycisphaera mikurensis (strain NBRC 102666 / KCTC 22515 / FYK2301M01) TaxID=1142394 RepID=I0IBJ3_PHYMF|nr:MotA/TolQ/ExbB proton channel family protein [Phycisphaera mikurensis]MBB6442839.1 biopolymer transport protein ExbB [Phycisphaera mikurensis]BAM02631.1 MotA/TolQ/ExbB family protein [Phycisphaera mikurensis NBRC 102666]
MTVLPEILERGGPVVWPLLGLSVAALTVAVERAIFFAGCGRRAWARNAAAAAQRLRAGDAAGARAAVEGDAGVLAPVVRAAAAAEPAARAAAAAAEARAQAQRLERFLPWLGFVVTAAPMLGILGTVLGIIASFDALATTAGPAADPRAVGGGIGQALLSTAIGLVVTLATLPAWIWLRGRADRLLDRLEDVLAAAGGTPPAA